jgi:hypothetical protein
LSSFFLSSSVGIPGFDRKVPEATSCGEAIQPMVATSPARQPPNIHVFHAAHDPWQQFMAV